jgi:hypothetical protein
MRKKFKKDSIVDSSKGIWIGERELDDDDELDGDTIGEAMARCGADSLTVGGTTYEPTKKDKALTFREFMGKYDIDVAVVRERGVLRRCMGCDKTDVPFSDPHAMECRPCHRETCKRYRARKKARVEDEIKRLSSELEQLRAIVEDMRSNANSSGYLPNMDT